MIFFTSDLHLNHRNVIKLSNRPFVSIEQMKEKIIENWNNKVSHNDIVYVLGDVFWNLNSKEIQEIMIRLNGVKYLVIGNHDRKTHNRKSNCWEDMMDYHELVLDGIQVVLSHYPFAEWHGCWRGSVMLHGHVHGTFDFSTLNTPHKNKRIFDVGVDVNNFTPISWDEIKAKLPDYKDDRRRDE